MKNIEKMYYCGNCFKVIAEDEPVVHGVDGNGVCCVDCFNQMEDDHEQY